MKFVGLFHYKTINSFKGLGTLVAKRPPPPQEEFEGFRLFCWTPSFGIMTFDVMVFGEIAFVTVTIRQNDNTTFA